MATSRHPLYGSNSGYSLQECGAGGLRCVQSVIDVQTEPTEGDSIRMCKIPAGHRVVDVKLFCDDLDTGTELVLDVGVEDEIQDPSDTTNVDAFLDGTTIGQTGGTATGALKTMFDLGAVPYDRWLAVLWLTDAATFAAGDLGVVLTTRPEQSQEAAVEQEAAS